MSVPHNTARAHKEIPGIEKDRTDAAKVRPDHFLLLFYHGGLKTHRQRQFKLLFGTDLVITDQATLPHHLPHIYINIPILGAEGRLF